MAFEWRSRLAVALVCAVALAPNVLAQSTTCTSLPDARLQLIPSVTAIPQINLDTVVSDIVPVLNVTYTVQAPTGQATTYSVDGGIATPTGGCLTEFGPDSGIVAGLLPDGGSVAGVPPIVQTVWGTTGTLSEGQSFISAIIVNAVGHLSLIHI